MGEESLEAYKTKIIENPYYQSLSEAGKRTFAALYLLTELRGREWVSIEKLAHEAVVSYDQADNFITQFRADRQIGHLHVLEEQEG